MEVPEDRPQKQQPHVRLAEREARRVLLRDLLAYGVERERIYAQMAARWGMSEAAVDRLINELNADDEKVSAEDSKHSKQRQLHRIRQHIANAAKRGQYTAVMNGEKLIAEIEGNQAPPESKVDVTAVLAGALSEMLSQLSERRAAQLIEQHARRRALVGASTVGARLLPAAVDAEFVDAVNE